MEYCVFIHTNHKQWLGALVGQYALRRNSRHNDRFDVRFIRVADYPCMAAREGQLYLRHGEWRPWVNDDLQSFTPLRFAPPELMGYQGRALVIDPDVFAVGDVWELLSRDMGGKAILCRPKSGNKGRKGAMASSVMLLDCARLTHWRFEENFAEMFEGRRDYMDWISLKLEDPATIGLFENAWNDFDHLDENTKMLHNTKRYTQPWKTGLKVDFRPADKFQWFPPKHWLRRARRALFGDYRFAGRYRPHPDPNQERFFFTLVKECLEKGVFDEAFLREEIARGHVRPDAFQVLERVA
ncbi:MAG: hypothetical protein KatS3mg124_0357 [Porticoccaceae bacterium]|nr:MAG: hypothetical protein KatS3mg124_0357 [Porticoccaceae bacterium]